MGNQEAGSASVNSKELNLDDIWKNAVSFPIFAAAAVENKSLWDGVFRTTKVPDWVKERLSDSGARYHILVIAEDWCGDASNTVPVLGKLDEEVDSIDVRIIKRDENPEVMDAYLTRGARAIPIAIVLDEEFNELGHWGPRPKELQQWVMDNKDKMPKEELYPQVRRWYAKDKGESTLREVLNLL